MRTTLFALILILSASLGYAQDRGKTYTTDDFAYGFTIDTAADDYDAPYVLSLPEHVYQGVYNADLSDMMLFNSRGETVPFTVIRPLPTGSRTIPEKLLPFFTITDTIDNKTYVSDVIVDISELPGKAAQLRFSFLGQEEFNADLTLSYSTGSLNSWERLTSENIAYLKSGQNILVRNTVTLRTSVNESAKYLRIRTSPLIAAGQISEIYISFAPEPVYEKAGYIKVTGMPDPENPKKTVFSLGGYYPVEWIHFDIPASYLFPSFSLSVPEDDDFRSLYTNRVLSDYPLDSTVSGTPADIARYKDWELTAGADLPESSVNADFYWRADDLVFLSKGSGSYTLVYGNAEFEPDNAMHRSAEAVEDYQTEAFRLEGNFARVEFAGDKAYEQIVEQESKALKYLLITVLAVIVLIMTVIAVRLILDMNRKPDAGT